MYMPKISTLDLLSANNRIVYPIVEAFASLIDATDTNYREIENMNKDLKDSFSS